MVYTRTKNIEIARIDHVSMSYDNNISVFKDMSCLFLKQGFYFLTGVSGAGKSSLLKLLYLGAKPNKGSVHVFGKNLANLAPNKIPHFRQKMGLVFQDCHLLDHLSVCDNVLLPLLIQKKYTPHSKTHAKELLDWVGMGDFIHKKPSTLSDGQKQRVALARSVICKPLLLLADEPTGNIDDGAAYKLMGLLQTLNENGTTVIFATHNRGLIRDFPYPEYHISNHQIIHKHHQPEQMYHG